MKNIYAIKVTEELTKTIAVKADSLKEAIELVTNAYVNEGSITLDYENYDDVDISPSPYYEKNNWMMTEKEANDYEQLNFEDDDEWDEDDK